MLGGRAYADEPATGGLLIAGPVGTREYVGRLLTDGYGSHIARRVTADVRPEYVVLQDGSDVDLAGYRVQSHAVVHSTGPSLAYRISDPAGAAVGFSGDRPARACTGPSRGATSTSASAAAGTGRPPAVISVHAETSFDSSDGLANLLQDLYEFLGTIVRGWRLVAVCVWITLALAVIYLARVKPVYLASARLLVLQHGTAARRRQWPSSHDNLLQSVDGYSNSLTTHIMIIRSPLIVGRSLAAAGLNELSAGR